MTLNRRTFLGTSALALAASTMTLEGCSFSSVMSNLGKFLPIGLSALAGVANLISPGAGTAIAALIGLINAAWGALQGAVHDYNTAPAAAKQTALEKVLLALDVVQEYLAKTTASLGVGTSTALKAAEAALLLITTTLGALEAQLAPKAAPAVANTHSAHAASHSVVTVAGNIPVSGKPGDFKKTFNEIVAGAGRSDLQLK